MVYDELASSHGFTHMMQPKPAFGLGFPPEPKPHQTPPVPPENAEQDRIKEKTNQNMLLKNANDISNELYNLKAKSKEIQTKIQHDIDSINSNLDIKLLDQLLKNKNNSINNLISALNKLWLELARATYVVTKLRQHSRVPSSKEAYNSNPKQTSEKLQASINALSEKTIQMKWASSEMKSLLAREKLLRETVAAAIEKLDDKQNIESLLEPPYSKSKNSTSEKKTWSLSELISEMNEMAIKITKESSNKVPTSKPKPATTEQQTPIFETKPTHMDSETSKPQINDPLNNLANNVGGVKTTSENNSYSSEPNNSSQPFVNILKYPPFLSKIPLNIQNETIEPPFKLQSPNIQSEISKSPPTVEVKPTNIEGETNNLSPRLEFNTQNKQSESKLPPKFEFKPLNIQGVTSKLSPIIGVKPIDIQGETNNLPPRFEFNAQNKQSESKLPPKFEFKPLNIQGVTSKLPPTIGVKPPDIQGETNNLPPRFEFNAQNKQSESKLPLKFEFKPLNIQGVTNKLPPTIEVKPPNIQGETNNIPPRFEFNAQNEQSESKITPKFEFKSLNIQGVTSKLPPTIGVKQPNIQGETNNLPPRFGFNVQNEQSESKLPPKFEFKPLNIEGVTSKLPPTIGVKTSNIQGETNNLPTTFAFTPLNIQGVTNKPLPKFEFKPPIFQSETNKPQFEFKKGVSTKPTPKFEFKPQNIQSETTKPPPTTQTLFDNPTINDFGTIFSPTPFPKCPTFMSPSVRRRLRVGPKNLRAATGTTSVKFEPPIGRDVVSKNGVLQDVSVEYQNICLMTKYQDKSQDELRLEDYMIAHRDGIFSDKKREPFINTSCNFDAHHGLGTTRMKFQPKVGTEEDLNLKATRLLYYQCITFMKEYEDKCLEELRLEDYCIRQQQRSNPVWAPNWFKAEQQYPGTTLAKFEAPTLSESKKYSRYQCISSMEVYKDKSFEELRLEDYMSGRRGMSVAEEEISTSDDPPTQKSETSTQNSKTSANNSKPIRIYRNVRSFLQKRVIPENNPETTTLKSESPTQNRETPTKHCENPTQNREKPTQNRETPTKNYENSTQNREKPTQNRETPTKNCENPTQNREEPSDNRETTQNGKTTTKSFRTAEGKFGEGCRLNRLGKSEDDDEVLELSPGNPSCLLRKARALKSLKKYREALEDAQKAVATHPSLVEGHILVAELCLILGEIASGEQAVRRATELEPSSAEHEREAFASLRTKQENVKQLMEQQMYHSALSILDVCLTLYSPSCSKMKLMKAECLANMGKYHEAKDVAINVSLFGSFDVDSIYILGLCSYHQDNDDQAIKHFLKVLYHAPDHEKAIKMYKTTKARKNSKLIKQKKEAGNQAFNRGQWRRALDLYNEALAIDRNNKEENAKLHYNRATVFAKMHETRNAALACTSALEIDENYIKALLRRAQCYTELGKFEEAMEDYEKLYHINPSAENKRLLDQANKTLVARRGAYYYYKVLGIDKSATESDIKKAYKKCALQHHPDRHAGAPTAVLRKQERKFKELKEAYDTLSDPSKRAYYNRNQRFIDDDDD